MSVSTILRSVAGHGPKSVQDELRDLESRLDIQLDRAVAANAVLRKYLEARGLMDDFQNWQLMTWREQRR